MLLRKNSSGIRVFLSITMFLSVFLGILAGLDGGRSEALAGMYQWKYPGNGYWGEAGKWDPVGVPNGNQEFVQIDPGFNVVTVTLDATLQPTVNQLRIGSGDILNITQYASSLTMGGISPQITNNGIINVWGGGGWHRYLIGNGTMGTATLLTGDGVLNLNNDGDAQLVGSGGFINAGNHKIEGHGLIQTNLDNQSVVTAKSGTLAFWNARVTNTGTINASSTGTLKLNNTQVSGTGSINPAGGSVIFDKVTIIDHKLGSGSFTVMSAQSTVSDSFFLGSNDLTAGAQVTVGFEGNNCPTLNLGQNGRDATVHGGTIWLTPKDAGSSTLRANDCTATLTDSSTVVLSRLQSRMDGQTSNSKFVNDAGSTIRGIGTIAVNLDNYGAVTSEGSKLTFDGTYTILNRGVIANANSGSVLRLNNTRLSGSGMLDAGAGLVELNAAQITNTNLGGSTGIFNVVANSYFYGNNDLTAGAQVMVGTDKSLYLGQSGAGATVQGGVITLNGANLWHSRLVANGEIATLTNGKVILSNKDFHHLEGTGFINYGVIEGAGLIEAPITNHGEIIAKGGTLTLTTSGGIAPGSGKVTVDDTGILQLNKDMGTGIFQMLGNGALTGGSGRTISLLEGFTFTQTDESKWNSGNGFRMNLNGGGPQQSLEIGGFDQGNVAGGFNSNFHLEKLSLTADSHAYLADLINNGNRGGSGCAPGKDFEALYLDALDMFSGSVLNINNLHLYVKDYPTMVWVDPGQSMSWKGGTIVNTAVPLPGAVWLLGSGLLGLAGWRRLRKR
jgi:hypothetical protein